MKPDENFFTESELTHFLDSIKLKSDEDLLSAYLLMKETYSPDFMDVIKGELGLRGYPVDEIDSWDKAQAHLLKRNTDEELLDMHEAQGVDPELKAMIRKEMDERKLSFEALKKEQKKKEKGWEYLLFNLILISVWIGKSKDILDKIIQVYQQNRGTALYTCFALVLGLLIIIPAGTLFFLHSKRFSKRKPIFSVSGSIIYLISGIAALLGMVSAIKYEFPKSYLLLLLSIMLYISAYYMIFKRPMQGKR